MFRNFKNINTVCVGRKCNNFNNAMPNFDPERKYLQKKNQNE